MYLFFLPVLFLLDIWIVGYISAFFVAPEVLGFIKEHPLRATWELTIALFGKNASPAGEAIIHTWKWANLLLMISVLSLLGAHRLGTQSKTEPEYHGNLLGSERWATFNEIKKIFRFKLSPGLLFGTFNNRPLILPSDIGGNLNVSVLGPPGSGKSRAYVRLNLFQAVDSGWSVVVTDPKGELTRDFRSFFLKQDYDVKIFNLVDMLHSDRWNPLSQVKTDIDAQLFTEVVIANTQAPGRKSGDPFWDRAEANCASVMAM